MLNDLKIKKLKPLDKVYRVADHSGLCLEVRPAGSRFWRYRYRFHGTAKMLSIGQYPEISLAYARSKTMEYREQLAKGIDPIAFQKDEKQASMQAHIDTFEAVAQEYLETKKALKSKEWLEARVRYLNKDIYPAIKGKPIKDVDSLDVKEILDSTIARISRRGMHTGEVKATLVRQIIGEIMRYAIVTKRITNDPTYALRRYIQRPDVEHAKPVDATDRPHIMHSINNYHGFESIKNALKVLMYSMLRSIEIRRGEKQYIDFEEMTWTIPVASRKELQEGKRNMKKNRIHIVPLSNQVLEIIKKQFELYPESKYIFPGDDCISMIGKTTLNTAFKNMGFPHITMHDFRATASTDLHEANFNSDWIELQLAHVKSDKTRASYDHAKWLTDRRKMLQTWADMVDSWVSVKAENNVQNEDGYLSIRSQSTLLEADDINRDKYAAIYYLTNRFNQDISSDALPLLVQRDLLDFEIDYIKGIADDLVRMKSRSIDYVAKLSVAERHILYNVGRELTSILS